MNEWLNEWMEKKSVFVNSVNENLYNWQILMTKIKKKNKEKSTHKMYFTVFFMFFHPVWHILFQKATDILTLKHTKNAEKMY